MINSLRRLMEQKLLMEKLKLTVNMVILLLKENGVIRERMKVKFTDEELDLLLNAKEEQ